MKGFGGMQQLMKQANQMQAKMKKLQEELSLREFEGTSGGGGVRVTATGGNLIKSVTISPDVFSAGDVEMLQDMVASATNDALKNAKETVDKEMSKVTGGLNIPGMF
jgi:DNA-binding YbaB/EbfC family protein